MFGLARIEYGRIDYGVLRGRAAALGDQHESDDRPRTEPRTEVRPPEAIEYKEMIASAARDVL